VEDDMAMAPAERAALVEDIARRTADLIAGAGARYPVLVAEGTGATKLPDGRDIDSIPAVLGELQAEQARQAGVLDRIAQAVARLDAPGGRP
jgi:hypothetical protein